MAITSALAVIGEPHRLPLSQSAGGGGESDSRCEPPVRLVLNNRREHLEKQLAR